MGVTSRNDRLANYSLLASVALATVTIKQAVELLREILPCSCFSSLRNGRDYITNDKSKCVDRLN